MKRSGRRSQAVKGRENVRFAHIERKKEEEH